VELACNSLPHGDHEALAEGDADLPELDLLALVHVVRGSQDDEPHVVVALELRPQVEGLRVLHRKLMQAEALATWSSSSGRGSNIPSQTNPPTAQRAAASSSVIAPACWRFPSR
jgi:hypothetical protein